MAYNRQVAAAVAAALAGTLSGFANATAAPTVAQVATAAVKLYVAGSSAAQPAVANAIENDLCKADSTVVISSTGDKNFAAYACIPSTANSTLGTLVNSSNVFVVYYHFDGGSVGGVFPIVSNASLAQLDLGTTANIVQTSSTAWSVPVAGCALTNVYTAGVISTPVQLGISDVEPAVFVGANSPYNASGQAYSMSAYGAATPAQLSGLGKTGLFDQVFGIFVNTKGALGGATGLNLSTEDVANILQGNYTDWGSVPNTTDGSPVSSTGGAITILNREQGSGSRASADTYFLRDNCVAGANSIAEGTTGDSLSTGNVLATANVIPGGVTYASINNYNPTTYPNLVLVSLDGVAPTNLNAATGLYGFWFEATSQENTHTGVNNAASNKVITFLNGDMQAQATAPALADIDAIPNVNGNSGATPPNSTTTSGVTVYTNIFTRGLSSCSEPQETN